jgi:hypothetical protein
MPCGGSSRPRVSELWRREFLAEDVNRYRDLARAEVPAAGLRATVADPSQSAHYREFLDPMGFADELRAVLRVGGSPWDAVSLFRRRGQAPFSGLFDRDGRPRSANGRPGRGWPSCPMTRTSPATSALGCRCGCWARFRRPRRYRRARG